MTKFVKGLMMMAAVVFTAMQNPPVVWSVVIFTSVLVGAGYYVKNYMMQSSSNEGQLNFMDALSVVLLAVITALSDSLSSLVVNGVIVWSLVGKTVLSVVITYISTTYCLGKKA
jgi:hypothetical protein